MAAKTLKNEGNKFTLSELNTRGEKRLNAEEAKRNKKLEKLKRRANAKDGFESSLRKVEKRLKETEESM